MKTDIHPKYYTNSQVTCACGNTWITGSTRETIRTEICSECHPFFSGEMARIVDIEGQVDRFYKKLQARQTYVEDIKARESSRFSPARPLAELELGTRATEALAKAGITKVGQVLDKLGEGETVVLAIDGFGRKSLIDLKKKLRSLGYELPKSEAEPNV
ncbi:MAG: 50S ribosomal protein L31 [Anaerolineales bacterium]|nr:50S ribosomal protein L31 [Anaerolineales bacterium]